MDSPTDVLLTGEVNQAIKIYGDATHGDFDYRADFIIYLRIEAKTFDTYDLITEQNISALTYKKYALPLSNAVDVNVTHSDAEVALAPYLNIDLTQYAVDQDRTIAGTARQCKRKFEGDSKTVE
ncbi:MAG: hypothetical protein GY829_15125 [Gammaproteobacteria bacterium]|nr:hypothetical protein [Gammaproteobacteria bacterium]